MGLSFVLVTPARNEEQYIGRTIETVLRQSLLPRKWVIVSDGSTDGTDDVVRKYGARSPWIELLRLESGGTRNFASQAYAINAGYQRVRHLGADLVGCLDADVELCPDYYELIVRRFGCEPDLGIAGGASYDGSGNQERRSPFARRDFVPGGVQMFRTELFEHMNGLWPLKYGGLDTYAEVRARMAGWRVESYLEAKLTYNRRVGFGERYLRSRFKAGLMDHSLGYLPLYAFAKYVRRAMYGPDIRGALAQLVGYMLYPVVEREARQVSRDFVQFLRREQRRRARGSLTVALERNHSRGWRLADRYVDRGRRGSS